MKKTPLHKVGDSVDYTVGEELSLFSGCIEKILKKGDRFFYCITKVMNRGNGYNDAVVREEDVFETYKVKR